MHINSAHHKAIRAMLGIIRCTMSRTELDKISKRATPIKWAELSISFTVIKLFNHLDTNIVVKLKDSVNINDRIPRKGKFM
jgi:hypothetical protein